jgi:23S rRNA (uracil1939-C5)-methyltransferase
MVKIYQAAKGGKDKPQQLKQIELQIERLDHEAQGIGFEQQRIVFVSGALPGEKVKVQLTEQKDRSAKGKVVKVLQASPLRQTPACKHFGQCGGCQLQYVATEQQLALKQQAVDQLLRHHTGLEQLPWQAPLESTGQGYRRKARIGVWFDKKTQQFTVGFRKANDKTITAVEHCLVLSPALDKVFTVLQQQLPKLQQGSAITHVEAVDADGRVYLIVRHIRPLSQSDQQALIQAWPEARWIGEAQPELYQAWQAGTAEPYYELPALGLKLQFSAADFIQVNQGINQQMVQQALDWLNPQPDDQILELYSGIGNFSLALAQRAKWVHGLEGVTTMVQRAEANAALNQLHNLSFSQADLHLTWPKADWNTAKYQKVLLDPARAGAVGAVEQIASLSPAQILYVSCNPLTFARDAKVLLACGYQLDKISVMDMFPQTSHLELMALFHRRK